MFASSSLEEIYHYVYYQLTSVALTMLDDVNGLSINFFSNEFIQAIVNFFTLFAWGLGLTGAAIAINRFKHTLHSAFDQIGYADGCAVH